MTLGALYALELLYLLLNLGTRIECEGSENNTHIYGVNRPTLSCLFEVLVREDTPVGDIIFTFPHDQIIRTSNMSYETSTVSSYSSDVPPARRTIQIVDGNTNERFTVDSETGDVSVQGYLDRDIIHEYILVIVIKNSQEESHSRCSLKITLEDVEGWPPYYNETCEMPTRRPRKGLDMAVEIFFGKTKVPLETFEPRINATNFKEDSNNDECMLTMFMPIRPRYGVMNFSLRVSDVEMKWESASGLIANYTIYSQKADFPPDALYDDHWFNKAEYGSINVNQTYALLKVDFKNVNTKAPPMPMHVTFYKGIRTLISTHVWIDYIGCPEGKYGMIKCDKVCICMNDGDCNLFNGACRCKPGWYGPACDIPKPMVEIFPKQQYVEYGTITILTCKTHNIESPEENKWIRNITWSLNNEYLSHPPLNHTKDGFFTDEHKVGISVLQIKGGVSEKTTGQYECSVTDKYNSVYVASATVATVCPTNLFGRYCNLSCDCVPGSSTSCDRYFGCVCNTGWTGRHCHIDLVSPKFDGCPQEITKVIRDEDTETNVTWQVPTVSDNSDNVTVQNNYAPGSVFPIGTTEVKYTAIDSANNTDTCQFRVKVIKQRKLHLGLIIGIAIACLVFVIPVCFYLGYRYRLQMYLLLTTDIDDFEDDGDKEYDAFVLYSSKDGDFAEDIMERIERNGKYKQLLHHRDFIAGKAIFDNIEDSFDNSRAAILVISPNFLESGTCEQEARIALDNWINRRQKLIPIVKGNIEHTNHCQVIKRIIKFITYIKWPEYGSKKEENTFWMELENALDKNMQKQTRMGLFKKALLTLFRCRGKKYSSVPNHVL
ncbi:uncharacterized protein [Ptychodera flava]|uniref:uncharacterized protein isoform X2 n=1 Tax=Ptychodera flava TaxID=63121 RepID=UPI00396A351A